MTQFFFVSDNITGKHVIIKSINDNKFGNCRIPEDIIGVPIPANRRKKINKTGKTNRLDIFNEY